MSRTPKHDARTVNLNGCARCHGDGHRGLTFVALAHPMAYPGGDLTHWAPCPTNGDPILMRIVDELVQS